jgi:hypothetical protein
MCSSFVRKEANRLNWLVKGHLLHPNTSDKDTEATYNSYMKRLWGNCERPENGERGFEQAWKEREAEIFNEDIKKVAVLGGHYD